MAKKTLTVRETIAKNMPATEWKWATALDTEVLDCPVDSAVGEDSWAIIAKANVLLGLMLDINESEKNAVIGAVAHQCRVFYFG